MSALATLTLLLLFASVVVLKPSWRLQLRELLEDLLRQRFVTITRPRCRRRRALSSVAGEIQLLESRCCPSAIPIVIAEQPYVSDIASLTPIPQVEKAVAGNPAQPVVSSTPDVELRDDGISVDVESPLANVSTRVELFDNDSGQAVALPELSPADIPEQLLQLDLQGSVQPIVNFAIDDVLDTVERGAVDFLSNGRLDTALELSSELFGFSVADIPPFIFDYSARVAVNIEDGAGGSTTFVTLLTLEPDPDGNIKLSISSMIEDAPETEETPTKQEAATTPNFAFPVETSPAVRSDTREHVGPSQPLELLLAPAVTRAETSTEAVSREWNPVAVPKETPSVLPLDLPQETWLPQLVPLGKSVPQVFFVEPAATPHGVEEASKADLFTPKLPRAETTPANETAATVLPQVARRSPLYAALIKLSVAISLCLHEQRGKALGEIPSHAPSKRQRHSHV